MQAKRFTIRTPREGFINITRNVQQVIAESGAKSGVVVVWCPHTTAGITVNETTEDDTIIFDISTNNEDVYIDSIFFNNTELAVNKKFWEWADTPENMLEVSTRLTTNITWVNI